MKILLYFNPINEIVCVQIIISHLNHQNPTDTGKNVILNCFGVKPPLATVKIVILYLME